jgi:hypothetical protein
MSFVRCLDQALFEPRSGRRATQLQFETACERPPAAFGGSPPHGGGEWPSLPLVRGRSHIILNCSCATRPPQPNTSKIADETASGFSLGRKCPAPAITRRAINPGS